jgi:hypothetical protein
MRGFCSGCFISWLGEEVAWSSKAHHGRVLYYVFVAAARGRALFPTLLPKNNYLNCVRYFMRWNDFHHG